jgi:hypothetical protein
VAVGPPPLDELEKLAAAAPPMLGAEYLTPTVLAALASYLLSDIYSWLAVWDDFRNWLIRAA